MKKQKMVKLLQQKMATIKEFCSHKLKLATMAWNFLLLTAAVCLFSGISAGLNLFFNFASLHEQGFLFQAGTAIAQGFIQIFGVWLFAYLVFISSCLLIKSLLRQQIGRKRFIGFLLGSVTALSFFAASLEARFTISCELGIVQSWIYQANLYVFSEVIAWGVNLVLFGFALSLQGSLAGFLKGCWGLYKTAIWPMTKLLAGLLGKLGGLTISGGKKVLVRLSKPKLAPYSTQLPQGTPSVLTSMPRSVSTAVLDTDDVMLPTQEVSALVPAVKFNGLRGQEPFLAAQEVQEVDEAACEAELRRLAAALEERLTSFGITGELLGVKSGPIVNILMYQPDLGVKVSKILALEHDLAMALRSTGMRIVAPIPGKNVVGFEVPKQQRQPIPFANLLQTRAWQDKEEHLPLLLGLDGDGMPVVEDLALMPHLLIAGTTGSGKSVCVHSLLASLLLSHEPDTIRLILIDPKRLEFAFYFDIPHLLFPVITEMTKVAPALAWAAGEMERRYQQMSEQGFRDIFDYNNNADQKLPFIVIVIDELADLMMVGGKSVEGHLVRLAQMARAAGIHLVVATQRPSVDVVTGLVKVNFPCRIAFRMSSKIDSRTILDSSGAEKLLGKGDMLFLHPKNSGLQRLAGAYLSIQDLENLTDMLRQAGEPAYVPISLESKLEADDELGEADPLYEQVFEFVKTREEVSISMLQRKFKIGFNRSAKLIEELEERQVVAEAQGSKPRKVLH